MELSTAKQHKTALSFLVFRVIAAHVNVISTPQHTRYRGPHKRALSMQRSVANPPTDSVALQRETPVAQLLIGLYSNEKGKFWMTHPLLLSMSEEEKRKFMRTLEGENHSGFGRLHLHQ